MPNLRQYTDNTLHLLPQIFLKEEYMSSNPKELSTAIFFFHVPDPLLDSGEIMVSERVPGPHPKQV